MDSIAFNFLAYSERPALTWCKAWPCLQNDCRRNHLGQVAGLAESPRLSRANKPATFLGMVDSEPASKPAAQAAAASFAPTRWTVVLTAREHDSPQARAAPEELCQTYWYPL